MAGDRQLDARRRVFADLDAETREHAEGGAARGAHRLGGAEVLHVDRLFDGRLRDLVFACQGFHRVGDAAEAFVGRELRAKFHGDAREEAHRFDACVDDRQAGAA